MSFPILKIKHTKASQDFKYLEMRTLITTFAKLTKPSTAYRDMKAVDDRLEPSQYMDMPEVYQSVCASHMPFILGASLHSVGLASVLKRKELSELPGFKVVIHMLQRGLQEREEVVVILPIKHMGLYVAHTTSIQSEGSAYIVIPAMVEGNSHIRLDPIAPWAAAFRTITD